MPTFKYPQDIDLRTHLDITSYHYSLPTIEERNSTGLSAVDLNQRSERVEADRAEQNFFQSVTSNPVNAVRDGRPIFTVKTYIPGGFGDSIGTTWEDETLAFVGDPKNLDFENVKEALRQGNITALHGALGSVSEGVGQLQLISALERLGGSKAAGNLRPTVESAFGRRIAPNHAKVFKGSDGRSLNISINFAPKNEFEGNSMLDIIDYFRNYTLPALENIEQVELLLFYKYPPLYDIRVVEPGRPVRTGSFFDFKAMALTSFNVAYSEGSNVYTYFKDGVPTQAKLDLQFQSIFPAFKTGNVAGRRSAGESE